MTLISQFLALLLLACLVGLSLANELNVLRVQSPLLPFKNWSARIDGFVDSSGKKVAQIGYFATPSPRRENESHERSFSELVDERKPDGPLIDDGAPSSSVNGPKDVDNAEDELFEIIEEIEGTNKDLFKKLLKAERRTRKLKPTPAVSKVMTATRPEVKATIETMKNAEPTVSSATAVQTVKSGGKGIKNHVPLLVPFVYTVPDRKATEPVKEVATKGSERPDSYEGDSSQLVLSEFMEFPKTTQSEKSKAKRENKKKRTKKKNSDNGCKTTVKEIQEIPIVHGNGASESLHVSRYLSRSKRNAKKEKKPKGRKITSIIVTKECEEFPEDDGDQGPSKGDNGKETRNADSSSKLDNEHPAASDGNAFFANFASGSRHRDFSLAPVDSFPDSPEKYYDSYPVTNRPTFHSDSDTPSYDDHDDDSDHRRRRPSASSSLAGEFEDDEEFFKDDYPGSEYVDPPYAPEDPPLENKGHRSGQRPKINQQREQDRDALYKKVKSANKVHQKLPSNEDEEDEDEAEEETQVSDDREKWNDRSTRFGDSRSHGPVTRQPVTYHHQHQGSRLVNSRPRLEPPPTRQPRPSLGVVSQPRPSIDQAKRAKRPSEATRNVLASSQKKEKKKPRKVKKSFAFYRRKPPSQLDPYSDNYLVGYGKGNYEAQHEEFDSDKDRGKRRSSTRRPKAKPSKAARKPSPTRATTQRPREKLRKVKSIYPKQYRFANRPEQLE